MALVWPEMNPDDYAPTPFEQAHSHHNHFHGTFPTLFNHSFRSANMINPEVDIRETPQEYWVDISMPGASDTDSVVIKCLTSHKLTVTSRLDRPQIPGVVGPITVKEIPHQNGETKAGQEGKVTTNTAATHDDGQKKTASQSQDAPRFLLAERSVGLFNRTLHFPLEVDEEKIQAKLEYGILRIQAPKLSRSTFKHIKVEG